MNADAIFAVLYLFVSVAQLVEQLTLNQRVHGSSPCGDTGFGTAKNDWQEKSPAGRPGPAASRSVACKKDCF
jgi:hypothetical protein